MTLDKARELIGIQVGFGGGYNRNATRLILTDVQKEHGQDAVDRLIVELEPDRVFKLEPGLGFQLADAVLSR